MARQPHRDALLSGGGSGPAHTEAPRHVLEATLPSLPDSRAAIISPLED